MLPRSILMFLTSSSAVLASVPLFDRAPPGCIADNCLRAVTGSEPGQPTASPRMADCSSFLLKTITPDTVTVTSTASFVVPSTLTSITTTITTSTTTSQAAIAQRDAVTVVASNVPLYASACSGTIRYSSACSCAGVTARTVTVAPPTVTLTISVTSTTTLDVLVTSTSTSVTVVAAATTVSVPNCSATIIGQKPPNGPPVLVYWHQYYEGAGEIPEAELTANSVTVTTISGTEPACNAVESCSITANMNSSMYFSLREGTQDGSPIWYCTYSPTDLTTSLYTFVSGSPDDLLYVYHLPSGTYK